MEPVVFFAFAGKKYSAYIYILHVFVMTLFGVGMRFVFGEEVYRNLTQNNLFRNSYPFLIFGVTLIFVMAGYKIYQHCILHVNRFLRK